MIILLLAFILSAFTMNIPSLIDQYINFMDVSYRPMDIDRIQYEKKHQTSSAVKKDGLENR